MSTPLENAINLFFKGRLRAINEFHHPNDESRLYNIALEAIREGTGVPEEKFHQAFEKEVKEENLNPDLAETWYSEYLKILQCAYSILSRMNNKGAIPKDFKF